jgi:hypothetical protein
MQVDRASSQEVWMKSPGARSFMRQLYELSAFGLYLSKEECDKPQHVYVGYQVEVAPIASRARL